MNKLMRDAGSLRSVERSRGGVALVTILPRVVAVAAGILGAALVILVTLSPRGGATILIAVIAAVLAVVSLRKPVVGIVAAIVIGGLNGFLRRVAVFAHPDGGAEAVIVVLPAALLVTVAVSHLIARGKAGKSSEIKAVPAFVALIAAVSLAGVNPAGAGLVVNALASALLLAGMLPFYFARQGMIKRSAVEAAAIAVGAANALAMIAQEMFGLTPWDEQWVKTDGYAALYIGPDLVRPLGLAASAAESTALCALMVAVAAARFFRAHGAGWLLLGLLGMYATLISGTRTYVLLALAALALAFSIGRARPLVRAVISVGVVGVAAVALAQVALPSVSSGGLTRVLGTLSGTEDAATSTLPIHQELILNGLLRGVTSVIGTGSGQASVLASSGLGSSEMDISNLALMAGIPGLVAIVWFYIACARRAGVALTSGWAAGALLIAVASFGQWLSVGHYGATPLIWAALGILFSARPGSEILPDPSVPRPGRRARKFATTSSGSGHL